MLLSLEGSKYFGGVQHSQGRRNCSCAEQASRLGTARHLPTLPHADEDVDRSGGPAAREAHLAKPGKMTADGALPLLPGGAPP